MGTSSEWYQDLDALEAMVRSSYQHRHGVPNIDGYAQLKELSRGGQGIVYIATQISTRRTVAIKVLLDGVYASSARRARFEREIGLAASLRHPNIVRVYDSGVTSDNRLFLVMEHIEGTPLDAFTGGAHQIAGQIEGQIAGQIAGQIVGSSDPTVITDGTERSQQAEVSTDEPTAASTTANPHLLQIRTAVRLFSKVCDAVSYAHQHGVIHRDLKPSNILVDQHGEPHIVDFGLAKTAPGSPLDPSDTPVVSISGNFMGSAPWASPEQAEGNPNGIDTRSDVYALGVVFYQMLTGAFPYRVSGGLREVLDNIITAEPTRPSAVRRRIDDELDTIVLKCLAKEPARRYQTANELALDMHRYLAGEPIEAKRASAWYTVRRTLRRYQFAAAAMAVILLISVAFAVTTLMLYKKANRAKQAEQQARQHAVQEAVTTTKVREFLESMLTSIKPENAKGRDVGLLADVLDDASERIEHELSDQPEIAVSLHSTIGQTYQNLSRYGDAEKHFERAYKLSKKAFGPDDTRTIAALNDLGVLRCAQARLDEAERILRDALERSRRIRGPRNAQTLEIVSNLGVTLRHLNKLDDAESLYRDAIEAYRQAKHMDDAGALMIVNNLGSLLQQKGDFEQAEKCYHQALDGFVRLYGPDHPQSITTESNIAHLLSQLGRLDEAEELERHNLEVCRRVMGDANATTLTAMNNLADLLQRQGKNEEAESLFRKTLAGRMKVLGEEHEHTLLTMSNLSVCLQSQNKLDEAESLQRQSVDVLLRLHGADHLSTMIGMNNLATLLHTRGKYDETETMLRKVCASAKKALGEDHWITAVFRSNYGNTLVSLKRYAEAEPILLHSLSVITNALGHDHAYARSVREKLVRLYEAWDKPAQAADYREPPPASKNHS